jgi:hypothetical protein
LTVTDTHSLPTNKQGIAATRQADRISLTPKIIAYLLAQFLTQFFLLNHPVSQIDGYLDQIRPESTIRSISKAPTNFQALVASLWNLVIFKGFASSISLIVTSFHA